MSPGFSSRSGTAPSTDWSEVKELLADALEIPTEERGAWLDRACAGRPDLRREIDAWLAHEHDAVLEPPSPPVPTSDDEPPGQVGPWRLQRLLGEGGMGTVWLAERSDGEIDQQAAVKLLRRGLGSAEAVRRFRVERQILADLSHPYIARLLDGGSSDDGRPYVAMELIDGEPIDAWCDRRRLGVEPRLRLFLRVCEAVSHAHRNLVVHRDLKPSNVLVVEDGTPRLVDFGIAKLLGDDDAGITALSPLAQPMTVRYASPEQIQGRPVSTAADVHGLGLLLYELLTGRHAFAATSPLELGRQLCEEAPTSPSQTVRRRAPSSADAGAATAPGTATAAELAARRGSDPRRLRRRLRGDLDTLVMRALEKDPARRFPSVERFADDVRRHLEGRPLLSRPGSAWSRAAKAARRHWLPVSLAAALLVTLVVSTVVLAVQRRNLAAESARRQAEAQAAQRARREAEDTAELLLGLFDADEVGSARVDRETARQLLARGVARLDRETADRPLDRARLLTTIAEAYSNLGLSADAESLLRRALATQEARLDDGPELGETVLDLASVLNRAGRGGEALPLLERSRQLLAGGEADPHLLAAVHLQTGTAQQMMGDREAAEASFRQALADFEELDGKRSDAVADTLLNLGSLLAATSRPDDARAAYDRAIDVATGIHGHAHRSVARLLQARGQLAHRRGDYAAAEADYRDSLAIFEATAGPEHPEVASALASLAFLELREGGDYETADALLARAREIHRATAGVPSLAYAAALESTGNLRVWQKRFDEAEELLNRSLDMRIGLLGEDHVWVATSLNNIGFALADGGHCARAEPYFERAMGLAERLVGHEHFLVAGALNGLGTCGLEAGRRQEARRQFQEARRILDAIGVRPQHRAYRTVLENLAKTEPAG